MAFMKKLALDKKNQAQVIRAAVKVLRGGGVIVYPTETAYGLGADFLNPRAVERVYKIKGRDYNKPLSILVSSYKMAEEIVSFDQASLKLAKRYWPGALTLILNFKEAVADELKIANQPTLGLRISANRLATAIVRKFGQPITATSANLANQPSCYAAAEVIRQFSSQKYQPDLLLDAGDLPRREASTVVRIINNQVEIVRPGSVAVKFNKTRIVR